MRLLYAVFMFVIIYNNVKFVTTAEIRTTQDESVVVVYETIVVGLGAAGTAALGKLARAGRRVLGLEATARVGGRVRTEPFGHGLVELGAEWIHGTNHSIVYELAVTNNISVLYQDGAQRLFRSNGTELDRELVKDLIENCIDETDILKKDQSTAEYYTQICKDYVAKTNPELAKDEAFVSSFLDFLSLLLVSGDAADDWSQTTTFSTYQDLDQYLTTSWHTRGYKTLFEIILNKFNNGPGLPSADIKLNKEVKQIVWSEDPATDVVVRCADGTEYTATNVIVTVSLGVLKHSYNTLFSPALPETNAKAIRQISMGLIGKIIVSFDKRWWSDDDFLFGFIWNKEDKASVPQEDAWTTKIAYATPSMGSDNVLVLWSNGATTRHIEVLSDEVVKEQAMKLLRKFLGSSVPEITGILTTSWYSDPFTRGTYSYDNLETGKNRQVREELSRPLLDRARRPRVLFAGEATNTPHYGTVHGAAETGIREANRLLGHPLDQITLGAIVYRSTYFRLEQILSQFVDRLPMFRIVEGLWHTEELFPKKKT